MHAGSDMSRVMSKIGRNVSWGFAWIRGMGLLNRAPINRVKEKQEWHIWKPGIEKRTYGPRCRMSDSMLHAKIFYSSVSSATHATFTQP